MCSVCMYLLLCVGWVAVTGGEECTIVVTSCSEKLNWKAKTEEHLTFDMQYT